MAQDPPHLVFLDAATFGDVSLRRFTTRWDCAVFDVSTPDEVRARLKGRSVAIINKVALDGPVLRAPEARGLKLIVVAATGTDNVDRRTAGEIGIRVCNVPGYATQSVAQFTLALILELATRVGGYGALVRAGRWHESLVFTLFDFPSIELKTKTLGIIGYGNIGRAVAEMARALGMEILIAARPGAASPTPDNRTALNDLLRRADIISLHCPLTEETRHIINQQTLSVIKPTAFLINTARGALIDEPALIEALKERRLAGAGLDVLSQEPPADDHPVVRAARELDNLVVTPHCAWAAREARERLLDEVAENISAFFQGYPRNLVV